MRLNGVGIELSVGNGSERWFGWATQQVNLKSRRNVRTWYGAWIWPVGVRVVLYWRDE